MEQSQPEVRKLLGEEERRVIEEEDKQVVDEVEANKKMMVEKERREGRSEKGSERLRKPSKKDQVSLQFFISDSNNKHKQADTRYLSQTPSVEQKNGLHMTTLLVMWSNPKLLPEILSVEQK